MMISKLFTTFVSRYLYDFKLLIWNNILINCLCLIYIKYILYLARQEEVCEFVVQKCEYPFHVIK